MRDGRRRTWLTEAARDTIIAAAGQAHPNETGGVLLGVLTCGRPWITEAVQVPYLGATQTYYELGRDAAPAAVDAMATVDWRTGYLGEWHSHPANVGPSALDVHTMRQIGADTSARCAHPILIIARRVGTKYELDARQLGRRHLRTLRLIDAGPLPVPTDKRSPTFPVDAPPCED